MKLKIGVFFGGNSTEHEVSIISALQAVNAFDKNRYDIIPIYISKENYMYVGEEVADIKNYNNIETLISSSRRVVLVKENDKVLLVKYPKYFLESNVYDYIDVAFPIVHGTNVEDGTIQGLFEMLDIPYVGCNVISSALGMDKYLQKLVLEKEGIPVLESLRFYSTENNEEIIKQVENKYKYPVIVKPVNLGSSVGITVAKSKEKLEQAIDEAFKYSKCIIIERAITNLREINCSVLGDRQEAKHSVCEEPITSDDMLTYEDKYISGNKTSSKGMASLARKIPAQLEKNQEEEINRLAIKAFKALDACGVVRIDFMIDKDENKVYVNEVNTIPGSLSFYLWKETNLKYDELLDELIKLSLKRFREKEKITYSFKTNLLMTFNSSGVKGTKKLGKL